MRPAGRMPTVSIDTVSAELFHRVFSWATASLHRLAELLLEQLAARRVSPERRSTSIQASLAIALIDVPPPMRPTLNVVRGELGTWKSAMRAIALPSAWIGIHRAERSEAVAAGPFERDAESRAADGDVRDAEPFAVDRDEPIDPVLQRLVEEALHAAQVAEPFFADRADERDRAWRRHAGFVQRPRDGKKIGKPAAIVADAGSAKHIAVPSNFDVGAARKHRIEVRADDDVRPGVRARPLADDVAFGVDADVLQARLRATISAYSSARFAS